MPTALKDLYDKIFFKQFCTCLEKTIDGFDEKKFMKLIWDNQWQLLELKQRMSHIALVLHHFLDKNLKKSAKQIIAIAKYYTDEVKMESSFLHMFLPEYIEKYGSDDVATSITVFEKITAFTSCEFAVRPFIIKYPSEMMQQMLTWSRHKNHHIRRLASEGSRPRLPWAIALPAFKKDPEPILPILENLKADPSEYVRRSVANNINDIAKDNPTLALAIAKKWFGKNHETNALVKHACRTLLKAGNVTALEIFGLGENKNIVVQQFALTTPQVKFGEAVHFSFTIQNKSKTESLVRLEYAIYYLRQNGTHIKKVFKISERILQPNEIVTIERKQSFKPITTRVFYKGQQNISLIINGIESNLNHFILK